MRCIYQRGCSFLSHLREMSPKAYSYQVAPSYFVTNLCIMWSKHLAFPSIHSIYTFFLHVFNANSRSSHSLSRVSSPSSDSMHSFFPSMKIILSIFVGFIILYIIWTTTPQCRYLLPLPQSFLVLTSSTHTHFPPRPHQHGYTVIPHTSSAHSPIQIRATRAWRR